MKVPSYLNKLNIHIVFVGLDVRLASGSRADTVDDEPKYRHRPSLYFQLPNVKCLSLPSDEIVEFCELRVAHQQMSLLGRIFDGDEELGKKDDDHRPLNGALKSSGSWSARQPAPWLRRRKIFYGIGALLLLYVFVKNIPPDLGPAPQDASSRAYQQDNEGAKLPPASSLPPTNKPKRPSTPSEAEEHYHDGPIKFYRLASSLHSVARLGGQKDVNKNVVFAASNLKCASEMIPMACEMARWERSDVHFAVMGRDDMEIEEIRKLNGAGEGCDIHWHGEGTLRSTAPKKDFTNLPCQTLVRITLAGVQIFVWKLAWRQV